MGRRVTVYLSIRVLREMLLQLSELAAASLPSKPSRRPSEEAFGIQVE